MDRPLLPLPNWTKRIVLCVVLSLPGLIAPSPWIVKLFAIAFVVVMTGSARESRVRGDEFEMQLFVGFFPARVERCKLKVVVEVETLLRQGPNAADFL